MDLATYEYLTGVDVPTDQEDLVEAQIRRTQRILESMLGYTLDPNLVEKNFYNEQGKADTNCFCPNMDLDNLQPPDPVIGAYRLFTYNPNDKFFHIDPYSNINAIKLVWNNITIKTFEEEDWRMNFHNGWGKFVENCQCWVCECLCDDCVQLAVDGDWLWACDSSLGDPSIGQCIDEELLYLWADMIKYYTDCKKDVKTESVLSHSYTKYDRAIPEYTDENIKLLRKLAGPFGTVTKVYVP